MKKNRANKYIKKILQADVYDVAEQTPLELAANVIETARKIVEQDEVHWI